MNSEKLKTFSLRSATRQKHPFSPLIQNSFGSPSHRSQRRKRNKGNPNLKRRIKLSLFEDDIIPYREYLNNAIRKLLDVINELGNVSGYKISTQKFLAFFTLTNGQKEQLMKQFHLPSHQNEQDI